MATNILQLPQIQATFNLANNGAWTDKIKFLKYTDPNDLNSPLIPLDLTGITFRGQMRPEEADSPVVTLDIGTYNGTLQVDGLNGMLTWAVPASAFEGVEAGVYVFDLLAFGDGITINLFEKAGPATVNMHEGVTKVTPE